MYCLLVTNFNICQQLFRYNYCKLFIWDIIGTGNILAHRKLMREYVKVKFLKYTPVLFEDFVKKGKLL